MREPCEPTVVSIHGLGVQDGALQRPIFFLDAKTSMRTIFIGIQAQLGSLRKVIDTWQGPGLAKPFAKKTQSISPSVLS